MVANRFSRRDSFVLLGLICILTVLITGAVCFAADAFSSLEWLWILPVSALGSLVALLGLAFLFLWVMCQIVDLNKPQQKESPFYRTMARWYIDALVVLVRVRIHAQGLEKTPKDGRFLLVCNHTHDSDPIVLMQAFPKSQLAFITKRENTEKFMIGKLQHKLLCQPVNRENDREALKTILKCIQLIKEDEVSVGVFPEGYIFPDRKLHHFRNGVFKIAQKANVPIVVCTLQNTKYIYKNIASLKPTDVELHLVDVIPAEEVKACNTVELGERIYQMMAQDLGPELVSEDS